jgi:hypothetical protein
VDGNLCKADLNVYLVLVEQLSAPAIFLPLQAGRRHIVARHRRALSLKVNQVVAGFGEMPPGIGPSPFLGCAAGFPSS